MRNRSEGRPQGKEISPGSEVSLATTSASWASTDAGGGGTCGWILASSDGGGSPARRRDGDGEARKRPRREEPARARVFAVAVAIAVFHTSTSSWTLNPSFHFCLFQSSSTHDEMANGPV
jgi:hypothetical protein